MNFVLFQTFENYLNAHILKGRLEDEGIRCWVKDENPLTLTPFLSNALGGIKLMVAEPDLERAREIIQE